MNYHWRRFLSRVSVLAVGLLTVWLGLLMIGLDGIAERIENVAYLLLVVSLVACAWETWLIRP